MRSVRQNKFHVIEENIKTLQEDIHENIGEEQRTKTEIISEILNKKQKCIKLWEEVNKE